MFVPVYQEWDVLRPMTREERSENVVSSDPPPLRFGYKIQEGRIKKRLTVHQLARLVGVDPKTISLLENGTDSPSPEMVSLLKKHIPIED